MCAGARTFDDGYALSRVNLIRAHRVSVQVPHTLDRMSDPVDFDLVRLHRLLDRFAHLTQRHVDASGLDSRVRGLSRGFEEGLELRIKAQSPRAINDATCRRSRRECMHGEDRALYLWSGVELTVNLCSEVDAHHVPVLQHNVVARVGREMRRDVIDGATGRKSDARLKMQTPARALRRAPRAEASRALLHLQPPLLHELTILVLDALTHVRQRDARLDEALRVSPHLPWWVTVTERRRGPPKGDATTRLTVDFRRVANSVVKVVLRAVRRALLLACHAIRVEDTRLFKDFSLGERAGRE